MSEESHKDTKAQRPERYQIGDLVICEGDDDRRGYMAAEVMEVHEDGLITVRYINPLKKGFSYDQQDYHVSLPPELKHKAERRFKTIPAHVKPLEHKFSPEEVQQFARERLAFLLGYVAGLNDAPDEEEDGDEGCTDCGADRLEDCLCGDDDWQDADGTCRGCDEWEEDCTCLEEDEDAG